MITPLTSHAYVHVTHDKNKNLQKWRISVGADMCVWQKDSTACIADVWVGAYCRTSVLLSSVMCIHLQNWWWLYICISRCVFARACLLAFKASEGKIRGAPWKQVCLPLSAVSEQVQHTLWAFTFADGALLSHDAVGVDVGDIDGQVPPPAAHPAGDRHAQRIVRLL